MRHVLILLVTSVLVSFVGCDDDPAPAPSFQIALTIEGEGGVKSDPAGIDCAGPTDCGTRTFSGAEALLNATPGVNYRVDRWSVDGVEAAAAETSLRVTAAPGETKSVHLVFATGPGGGGPGNGGGDGGGADGGGDAGLTGEPCGPQTCSSGLKCCVSGLGRLTCDPGCGGDTIEQGCVAGGCPGTMVCCVTGSLSASRPSINTMACAAPVNCRGRSDKYIVCDDANPCEGTLRTCLPAVEGAELKVCRTPI